MITLKFLFGLFANNDQLFWSNLETFHVTKSPQGTDDDIIFRKTVQNLPKKKIPAVVIPVHAPFPRRRFTEISRIVGRSSEEFPFSYFIFSSTSAKGGKVCSRGGRARHPCPFMLSVPLRAHRYAVNPLSPRRSRQRADPNGGQNE